MDEDDDDETKVTECPNCGTEYEDDGDVFECSQCRDEICVGCEEGHVDSGECAKSQKH